jgi:hypothetical protein
MEAGLLKSMIPGVHSMSSHLVLYYYLYVNIFESKSNLNKKMYYP